MCYDLFGRLIVQCDSNSENVKRFLRDYFKIGDPLSQETNSGIGIGLSIMSALSLLKHLKSNFAVR